MSRSYDEEWERRKSYLIRSLFCDIPYRGLSPVPEEETVISSEEYQESSESSAIIPSQDLSSDTAVSPSDASTQLIHTTSLYTREPSPLPPLIIEREPNRHDEPEEYYAQLLIKMRKIYRKMFIEGNNMTHDELLSDIDQDILLEPDDVSRESGNSFSSNGYNADFESITDEELDYIKNNDKNNRNIIQDSASNDHNVGGKFIRTEYVEDADLNLTHEDKELHSSNGDVDYMQVTIQAVVHADGEPLALVKPSPVYGDSHCDVALHRNERQPFNIQQSQIIDIQSNNTPSPGHKECPQKAPLIVQDEPVNRNSNELQANMMKSAARSEYVKSPILMSTKYDQRLRYVQIDVRRNEESMKHLEAEDHNGEEMCFHSEHNAEAVRTPRGAEQDIALTSSEHSLVDDEDNDMLDEEQDPQNPSSPSTGEQHNTTNEHVEVMRTLRTQTSMESITIDNTRLNSDTDVTSVYDINAQDISSVTSHTQDGCQNRAVLRNSFNLNNLISIINDDKKSDDSPKVKKNVKSRKRNHKETESINWNDLRDNFFVGIPKIFRLCSCENHVCNN